MKKKNLFFMNCNLAGRMYHDADEVWEELKVGTKLKLISDSSNHFDPNAVAIIYEKSFTEEKEGIEAFLLGYIPKGANKVIAQFLEMGWNHIFDCRISKINPEAYYDNQIELTIKIRRNLQE